jgi:hypothetical protein
MQGQLTLQENQLKSGEQLFRKALTVSYLA